MTTNASELHGKKCLLVWPMSAPNVVQSLFTTVFKDISGMINYTYKVLTKTDTFRMIIPLNCLEDLYNDPVYQFPQVVHIDVICDNINDLRQIEPNFKSENERVKFYTVNDLLKLWKIVKRDKSIALSNSCDRSVKNGIISMINDYISAKQPDTFLRRFQIRKQLASISLHGLPVENLIDFAPYFICSSCQLVYQQGYQFECGHQHCQICVNIQKGCAICFQGISRDKVSFYQNMQNLSTYCSNCDWIGSFKDYELHLKQNHDELIIPFISNRQVDENVTVISLNGTCIWEISDIENIKNSAASGIQKSIYSAPFYIFRKGYKMCMRLYINGDRKARNTHISLFFVIMRGEYDDDLQWPFKFKVTFSLIDQSTSTDNQHHISNFCCPNTTATCFECANCFGCPNSDMNIAFGIPMFIPLDKFNQNRYVKNNTAYIQIGIDLLAEESTSSLVNGVGEMPNDEEHVDTTNDDITASICS